ncbi:hypothetical protein QOT17_011939 [Balamuthia mandrillaris]
MAESSDLTLRQADSLRALFIFGSRCHGVSSASSDCDMVAIVSGHYYEGPFLIEKEDININFYHEDYFRLLLDENVVWCVMLLFLPADRFVLRRDQRFLTRCCFALRKTNLRKAAIADAKHNYQKAKRLWKEGELYKAKKNLVHGIRFLLLAVQLMEKGRIDDVTAGNDVWAEIMADTSQQWPRYEDKYKPTFEHYYSLLTELSTPKPYKPTTENVLHTIAYMEQYDGPEALRRELSINITELCNDEEEKEKEKDGVNDEAEHIFHFCADQVHSPYDHPVVAECAHGLILAFSPCSSSSSLSSSFIDNNEQNTTTGNKSKGRWRVVSYPYDLFFSHTRKEAAATIHQMDWNTARVYEKVEGSIAILYYHRGRWRVASRETPDGSERLNTLLTDQHRYYYYSSKPCYNPWDFFEAKLQWNWARENRSHCSNNDSQSEETDHSAFYYPNQVASLFASSSSSSYKRLEITFADVFWDIWRKQNYQYPSEEDAQHFCYMFVLRSDRQRLILARERAYFDEGNKHEQLSEEEVELLALHGMRDLRTLKEVRNFEDYASLYGWACVQRVFTPGFHSLEDVVAAAERLEPTQLGGFVVVDDHFHRLKVKSTAHVALESLTWRSDDEDRTRRLLLELVRTSSLLPSINNNEQAALSILPPFLRRFPQWKLLYQQVQREYAMLCHYLDDLLAKLAVDEVSKEARIQMINDQPQALRLLLFRMLHGGHKNSCVLLKDWPLNLLLRMINTVRTT